jgi:sec-independent protein translocase protein TatC
MTAVKPTPPREFDPDSFRMTVGDHLEDLRRRLILGLLGFVVGSIVCLALGKQVIIPIFVHPLLQAMVRSNVNAQVVYKEVSDVFMVYMEISMICGTVLASPWLIYQIWQFVAAGLYPKERKYVTKYLPLSIVLLLSGWITLYFLVLPVSLQFFFEFGSSIPLNLPANRTEIGTSATTQPAQIPIFHGDAPGPLKDGQMWIDADHHRIMVYFDGAAHTVSFGPATGAMPMITLPDYIDMVVKMLIAFGISFQLPLVVMALVRMGIVEIDSLRKMRRYVYFAIAVVAAFIIPDVATGWIMLIIPLVGLYELGLYLASRKPADADDTPA